MPILLTQPVRRRTHAWSGPAASGTTFASAESFLVLDEIVIFVWPTPRGNPSEIGALREAHARGFHVLHGPGQRSVEIDCAAPVDDDGGVESVAPGVDGGVGDAAIGRQPDQANYLAAAPAPDADEQLGRASGRERVCQSVSISEVPAT